MEVYFILLVFISLINNSQGFFLQNLFSSRKNARSITLPPDFPQDYPAEEISRLIEQDLSRFRDVFFEEDNPSLESRFNTADELILCEVTTTLEVPSKMNRVSDGKVMIIAQDLKNGVQQKIRNVKCKSTGECAFKGFPASYQSRCQQEFSERKLYVYKDGKITTDVFLAPSCCTCRVDRQS